MLDDLLSTRAGHRELRDRLSDAQAAATARTAASVDPESGLIAPDFLQRWATPTGATILPLGLGLFDVTELDADAVRADPRASSDAAHHVAATPRPATGSSSPRRACPPGRCRWQPERGPTRPGCHRPPSVPLPRRTAQAALDAAVAESNDARSR